MNILGLIVFCLLAVVGSGFSHIVQSPYLSFAPGAGVGDDPYSVATTLVTLE